MDINAVRKKLEQLKTATTKQSYLWKPKTGKTQIRIVGPTLGENARKTFRELYFHFEISKKPILSLMTFNEPDPIVEFSEKLKRTGSKDDWRLSKKIAPKMRTFVPIVVRGEEHEGVKYWGFGKKVYEQLLTFIAEPEYGDITDPETGADIVVEFQEASTAGQDFPVTTIIVKRNSTKLSDDPALMEKFLSEQKDIFEIYKKPTYEELLEILNKFLNPEEKDKEEAEEESVETPDANGDFNEMKTSTEKKSTSKKESKPVQGVDDVSKAFDDLFKKAKK